MTYSKGLPFQYPRSFYYKATDKRDWSTAFCVHSHPFTLKKLTVSWGNPFHFSQHYEKSISYIDLKSVLLEPTSTVSVLTPWFHASLTGLFCRRQLWNIWKQRTQPPLLSSAHSAFMLSGLLHHPHHFLWILALYLGLNSIFQASFNNTMRGLHPFSECFYQCGLILPIQTLLETSVSKLSDLRKCGRKCSLSLVSPTIFSSYPQKFL